LFLPSVKELNNGNQFSNQINTLFLIILQLVPGKHYVPFKSDLSDLSDQLEWIRANDEIASKIIFRAKKFSNQNLLPQHVLCYHAVFLKKWTSRLKPMFIISKMFSV
jgi:hypothetical protein